MSKLIFTFLNASAIDNPVMGFGRNGEGRPQSRENVRICFLLVNYSCWSNIISLDVCNKLYAHLYVCHTGKNYIKRFAFYNFEDICLQDLDTTNLFYVAEKGSENLFSGIISWDRSLSNMAMVRTSGVRCSVNEGIFSLLPCHTFSPSDILSSLLCLIYCCEKLATYG